MKPLKDTGKSFEILAEEIQRDKSEDSSARGTTYILVEQSGKKENVGMHNGRGLGWKGTGAG